MRHRKINFSVLFGLLFLSYAHAMEKPFDTDSKAPMKVAIIGGRQDKAKENYGKEAHGYFLIDSDKNASPNLIWDINKPINWESDIPTTKQKTKTLLKRFDRVIFEDVHVNTFNPVAIKSGLLLLKKGGILSMSAFPRFCLISNERKEAYQYQFVEKLPYSLKVKVCDQYEKTETLLFRLYNRTLGQTKQKLKTDMMWEFASVSKTENDWQELDDKSLVKEVKSDISTDSLLSEQDEDDGAKKFKIVRRHIDYNSNEIICQIEKFLKLTSKKHKIYFGKFDNNTWVRIKKPSTNFGFFIQKGE